VSAMTKREAVRAAMSVANDVSEGRLDPAELEAVAAAECRALFGRVACSSRTLIGMNRA
jgi:dihydropteroate synthase